MSPKRSLLFFAVVLSEMLPRSLLIRKTDQSSTWRRSPGKCIFQLQWSVSAPIYFQFFKFDFVVLGCQRCGHIVGQIAPRASQCAQRHRTNKKSNTSKRLQQYDFLRGLIFPSARHHNKHCTLASVSPIFYVHTVCGLLPALIRYIPLIRLGVAFRRRFICDFFIFSPA